MDVVILLGAPGSGKGTVAAHLVAQRGFMLIASGDMLRDAVTRKTAAGVEAQVYMTDGELVPDALIGRMVGDVLREGPADAHYLLDGFPRTVAQLDILEATLAACGGTIAAAILLELDDDEATERIAGRRVCPACKAVYHVVAKVPQSDGVCDTCGTALIQRDDDLPETVAQRIKIYHQQTSEVIEVFAARGLLKPVVGTGGGAKVTERILKVLT